MECMKGAGACVAMVLLLAACPGGGASDEGGTTTFGGDDSTTGPAATTIPLPPIDGSSSEGDPTTAGPTDDGTTTDATGTGTTGPADGSSSSSSGEPAESSSTDDDGGPTTYPVDWCVLQYPPMVTVAVNEAFALYVRVYAPGLTDQTGVTDPAPELVVEAGWSVDGSDPSTGMGQPWTWETATANVGYGPGAPDYGPNNDEYLHDLAIPMAGVFDYAARISGDGGTTWVYCDLDGLTVNGYTPDQAGSATVTR